MKKIFTHFLFLTLYFFGSNSFAQKVIRGPYLQKPTPTSMTVKWRTDSVTNGKVYYGTDINNLSSSAVENKDTVNHTVKISGLSPFTKYFYAVGSSTSIFAGPEVQQYFVTSPLPDAVQPIRFWCIGDFGKGSPAQKIVRDAYVNYTGTTHTDLWLWLGDNVYSEGTDLQFQEKVFDSITGYHKLFKYMPFMPTPGNHDYESVCPIVCNYDPKFHKGPYYDLVDVPTEGEAGGVPSHTELYYSFDYGNIHFISLNSELGSLFAPYDYNGVFTNGNVNSPVTQWLKADLAATTKTWKVAFWHQLPYSGQDLNSDDFWEFYMHAMRDHFNPILEQYGVDLVLCGHDHCYQRSYLINGLYGNSSTFDSSRNIINGTSGNDALGEAYIKYTTGPKAGIGTVYVCSGNAGAGNPDKPVVHPELYGGEGCDTCIGSFVVDVNGNRLDAKYLKGNGTIADQFTIVKEIPTGIKTKNYLQENLKAYPNPFTKITQLDFYVNTGETYLVEVKDIAGKVVWTNQVKSLFNGMQSIPINLSGTANGTYIVNVTGKDASAQTSIVKF